MIEGKNFLDKCLQTAIQSEPWPHQLIENTFTDATFKKLKKEYKKICKSRRKLLPGP